MEPSELVPAEATAIIEASDEEALALERGLLDLSDNGWVEGDPLDQPDNDEEVRIND